MTRVDKLQKGVTDLTEIMTRLQRVPDADDRHAECEQVRCMLLAWRSKLVKQANAIACEESERILISAEIVSQAIRTMHPGTLGNDINDSMPCPICEGGVVHYRVSGRNGHIHARCTTNGCASFAE